MFLGSVLALNDAILLTEVGDQGVWFPDVWIIFYQGMVVQNESP
jgi:hypothetical protein